MGNALMAPGGSKVTAEGLTAEYILTGHTVTVRQGARQVVSVTGSAPANPHIAVFNSQGYPINAITNVAFTTFGVSDAGLVVPADGTYQFVFRYARGSSINSTGTCYFTRNGENIGTCGTRVNSGMGYGAIEPFTAELKAGDVISIAASDYYADFNWGYIVQM